MTEEPLVILQEVKSNGLQFTCGREVGILWAVVGI